jgi:hypothetical protein
MFKTPNDQSKLPPFESKPLMDISNGSPSPFLKFFGFGFGRNASATASAITAYNLEQYSIEIKFKASRIDSAVR